jgi:hypothetical protein
MTDALAADGEAANTLGLLTHLLNNVGTSRRRGEDPHCFCCGGPVRRLPIIVLLIADTARSQDGIGGVIGDCCDSAEPEMYARVIAVLNASIRGGEFQPWHLLSCGFRRLGSESASEC